MVYYVADRSTKTAPVISSLSKPSSMCSVGLSSWPVHDFPGRNPAWSGMILLSTCSASWFKISRSNSL